MPLAHAIFFTGCTIFAQALLVVGLLRMPSAIRAFFYLTKSAQRVREARYWYDFSRELAK